MHEPALHLLFNNIYDFKETAALVESKLKRLNISYDSDAPMPSIVNNRRQQDAWASMKTVSHFNLATALELMLKLIFCIDHKGKKKPHSGHKLAELYDVLSEGSQKQLEALFQESNKGDNIVTVGFANTATDDPPSKAQKKDLSTLKKCFKYLDEEMRLWQRRYIWEEVPKETWRFYLDDISRFLALIDRVIGQMPEFIQIQSAPKIEWAPNT